MNGVLHCHKSGERGVCTNSVVMTVRTDKASVKTDITRLECGNGGNFRAHEIAFNDAVFIVEELHDVELHAFGKVLFKRTGAGEKIELFAGDTVCKRTLHLIACKVRKKVVNIEYGVGIVFTDDDIDSFAVCLGDSAVESKRNGCPLIFFDTAVVMCLEIAKTLCFIKRMCLEVDAGRIDMRSGKIYAVFKGFCAENECGKASAAVVVIVLTACFHLHTEGIRNEAVCFEHCDACRYTFAFGLTCVEVFFVALRIVVCGIEVFFAKLVVGVLRLVKKLILELLTKCFFFVFCHDCVSFRII